MVQEKERKKCGKTHAVPSILDEFFGVYCLLSRSSNRYFKVFGVFYNFFFKGTLQFQVLRECSPSCDIHPMSIYNFRIVVTLVILLILIDVYGNITLEKNLEEPKKLITEDHGMFSYFLNKIYRVDVCIGMESSVYVFFFFFFCILKMSF